MKNLIMLLVLVSLASCRDNSWCECSDRTTSPIYKGDSHSAQRDCDARMAADTSLTCEVHIAGGWGPYR